MTRNHISSSRSLQLAGVLSLGALMGAAVGFGVLGIVQRGPEVPDAGTGALHGDKTLARELPADSASLAYIRAYQEGDWPSVIDRTLWMQQRLERIRVGTGDENAVAAAREDLEETLGARIPVDAQLRREGVDDKYVVTPGAEVEWTESDSGRSGLEAPTARRDWYRLTYPQREAAPRDAQNIPLQSLVIGVNTTVQGRVLKANIIGNLEIDLGSQSYWPD